MSEWSNHQMIAHHLQKPPAWLGATIIGKLRVNEMESERWSKAE